MRLVLDTNVIVSALIGLGKPRKLIISGISGDYTILVSKKLLEEISDVLSRPKFRMSKNEVHQIMVLIRKSTNLVVIKSKFRVIMADPDDDVIINTAYDGHADYIVSGDAHLLSLRSFRGIEVVSVQRMLEILNKK